MYETIDDSAEGWAIRIDSGPLLPEEAAALETWLAEEPRRKGALLRAEAALAYLDRARALGAVDEIATDKVLGPYADNIAGVFTRRRFMIGSVASGAVAAGLGGLLLVLGAGEQRIDTALGEIRRVPLADGSVAAVNTTSRLGVVMRPERRVVKLEDGEAWFQVAHDTSRPFVVEAGDIRVRAVGTAFSVRRRQGGADILVTEGVVETWIAGEEEKSRRIEAGFRAFASGTTVQVEPIRSESEIDRTLAWRNGEIALDGETLAEAVAEFNRYNARKLVVDDPALAREPLVGYFRTGEPENFARAVADMIGAKAAEQGDTIRITRSAS